MPGTTGQWYPKEDEIPVLSHSQSHGGWKNTMGSMIWQKLSYAGWTQGGGRENFCRTLSEQFSNYV